MERKAKLGLSAFRIIGIIYIAMGAAFSALGGVFLWFGTVSPLGIVGGVFACVGSVFLVLGLIFLAVQRGRQKRCDALIAGQRYIWAEVVDIVTDRSVQINGRSPVRLIARYTDGRGREHTFQSCDIRHYRDERLLGKPVRVYIRDDSYDPYYMDAEAILPQTIEH